MTEQVLSEPQQQARVLALNILQAVAMKLKVTERFNIYIRRQIVAMPFLELCMTKVGRSADSAEIAITMPESRFILAEKEARSALATDIFKQFEMMLDKKDRG